MSNQLNEFRIGVDIGGTFTDIVAVNQKNGIQFNGKVLTTPKDPSEAVLNGVKNIIEKVRPKNIPAEEFLFVKYQAHKGPIIDIEAKIPPNKPAEIAPAKMSLWGWVNL